MDSPKKAVIPAAGMGTRMQPATLAVPKELLPVGREPMLLRALREVSEAGIVHVAIIINQKDDLTERFLSSVSLPAEFIWESAKEVKRLLMELDITLIVQPIPRGLGEALGRARYFVGDEPFAVLLPDNVFFGERGPLSQLIPVFQSYGQHVTGLIRVSAEDAPSFGNCGAVRVEVLGNDEYRVLQIGDKQPGYFSLEAGRTAIRWYARHIFMPSFFDYLDRYGVETDDEIDDVPVLKALAAEEGIIGKLLEGRGFDVGNERGMISAQRFLWEEVRETWS